jgi:hypothetical protein
MLRVRNDIFFQAPAKAEKNLTGGTPGDRSFAIAQDDKVRDVYSVSGLNIPIIFIIPKMSTVNKTHNIK